MSSVEGEIVAKFGAKARDDSSFISTFQKMMEIFDYSVEDLFLKWESYIFANNLNDLELTSENLKSLQSYIQHSLEKKLNVGGSGSNVNSSLNVSVKKIRPKVNFSSPSMFGLPSTPMTNSIKKRKLDYSITGTPLSTASKLSSASAASSASKPNIASTPGIDSGNNGKIIETLNADIEPSKGLDLENGDKFFKIIANFDSKKFKFKTMRQKLLESADVLDDQIDSFANIIQQHYQFDSFVFGNPAIASQNEIVAIGRIVPDSPLIPQDAILNSDSLYLETSRLNGIGQRVPLNLKNIENYSFFLGQIVCLKGLNPTGESFVVKEIIQLPLLGAPVTSKKELKEFNKLQQNQSIKIIVCSGPYTSNSNLDFTYLVDLVERINNEIKPHLVIMLGPFIDITHPKIADGSIEIPNLSKQPDTLQDIMKTTVSPILKTINNKIQVLIIPSLKDVNSNHCAYPQDSLDKKLLALPKNFKCFPNPCSFQINEILIGISNNDIFKDLKDVTRGDSDKQNRFDRIANHIIEQRRYYPLFPGSMKTKKVNSIQNNINKNEYSTKEEELIEHISGADLDIPYLGLSEFSDVIPDILIIPSELRFFARVVKNVVVINPSNFMRQNSPGTYVVLSISPPDLGENGLTKIDENKTTNEDDQLYIHDVWKRARVDIFKT
ncbi:hypothetical protein PACTADRAFT_45774 [Pachysolen tannophilus NRRL Y-2460]|uniref:DNA polymerase alpha subunit B n=1 Tax=Pachysolen tannophilus NRRL Y-2460 TaxID=669874 RepID=A0A1E4TQH5_PACTA|nr:hypothetical protein PACTADRAFT_45774 [Pachysolen tannophilus NRRL Y-2460]